MSFIVDAIGTIGALMFAGSCGPLAWKTWKKGHSLGLPRDTAWTFLAATALFTLYLALKVGVLQGSTIISFTETVAYVVIVWYEHFPRRKTLCFGEEFFEQCNAHNEERIGECIREPGHDGPCNGWPSEDCLVWCTELQKSIPLREHPEYIKAKQIGENVPYDGSAADIFKKTSD